MMYDLLLHKKARKNLEKFPDQEHIREHLLQLKQFPSSGDIVRIEDGVYRMRIGEYRALFKVYEEEHLIVIINLDVRGRIYKTR
jgi:mRNA interferase RelE/StbE